ncbi:MAG: phosphate/phosphite/phosphonate ABC transporter substrate-binding protein, partial [Bauldia sp.]|nr:phosphate/phosphite/phosphonate ABC transporter substrate-binding protein [Bauldia sp.]
IFLQDRTGIPVEVIPVPTYEALIEAQASDRVDYAIYSATSFATAVAQCDCVTAIAAPIAADGALGFHSILLSASGSGITSLADARGKRIALTGAGSVAGRLIPEQAFTEEGIDPADYFSEVKTVADPEAAIRALLAGEVDVAVAWSSLTGDAASGYDFGALTQMVGEDDLSMYRVRIIWQSRLIPFGPHAVRSDLPEDLRSLLTHSLAAMARSDPAALDAVDRQSFGGGGFATPDPSLYTVVMELVQPEPAVR